MIINKLKLNNFKSYANTEIKFNTGLSIIMGANGAGKSTILEAISFALYKDYSSRSLKDLILKEKDKMKVELEFQNNGKTYLVIREKGKSTSQAELYEKENDKYFPRTKGDSSVNAEIKNLMNMDKDLFLNAVYVRQGEIANLIDKNQSEKKRLISKLLGIDSLEKAWKNIHFIIKDYETEEAEYKGKLEAMGDLKKELKYEEKKESKYQAKIEEDEKDIIKIREEIIKLEKENNELDLLNSELKETNNKIKTKESLLSIQKSNNIDDKNKLNDIIASKERIDLIKPKIYKLEKFEKLNKLFEKIKSLENPRQMFEQNIEKIKNYEKIKNDNLIYYEEYLEIEKKIEDINNKLIQFSKLKTQEKTYNSKKEEIQNNITNLEKEIEIIFSNGNSLLKTKHKNLNDFEEAINNFIKNNEIKINELKDILKSIENKTSELNVDNRNIKKSIKELTSVDGKCPVCNSDINEVKKSELLKEYKIKLNTNLTKIQENEKENEINKKQLDTLQTENKNINSINIGLLKDKLNNLEKEKNEANKNEIELKEILKKLYSLNDIESEKTSKTERLNEIKNNYNQFITAQNNLKNENIEDEKNKLQKVITQIDSFELDIKVIFNELGSEYTPNDVSNKLVEYSQIKDEYNQLLGKIENKKIYEEKIEKSNSEIKKIENEIKTLNDIQSSINYDSERHDTIKKVIINKKNYLTNIINNQQKNKGILIGIEEKIKKIEIKIVDYENYEIKLSQLKDCIKLLSTIREIYSKDGAQKILRSKSLPLIEYHTNNIFKEFNFDYSSIELDEDYNIQLFGPSGETSIDMMSGGEKIAIALALRLGITNTLSGNLEMIMLDEPTIHLDDYRRHELIDILKNLNLLPQMIIVTHDNDLEEAADNIFKIEKIDGISTVKQE